MIRKWLAHEGLKPKSETINILRKLHKTKFLGYTQKFYHRFKYIAPSSGHISLNFNMPLKLFLRTQVLRLFSDVWSENAALFDILMEIHSNPPILFITKLLMNSISSIIQMRTSKYFLHHFPEFHL